MYRRGFPTCLLQKLIFKAIRSEKNNANGRTSRAAPDPNNCPAGTDKCCFTFRNNQECYCCSWLQYITTTCHIHHGYGRVYQSFDGSNRFVKVIQNVEHYSTEECIKIFLPPRCIWTIYMVDHSALPIHVGIWFKSTPRITNQPYITQCNTDNSIYVDRRDQMSLPPVGFRLFSCFVWMTEDMSHRFGLILPL